MTRGMETVFETVENAIGAPDPTLLAKALIEEEKQAVAQNQQQSSEKNEQCDSDRLGLEIKSKFNLY